MSVFLNTASVRTLQRELRMVGYNHLLEWCFRLSLEDLSTLSKYKMEKSFVSTFLLMQSGDEIC